MAVTGVTAASGPVVSIIPDGVGDRQVVAESSTASTLANVAQSATSVTVLAANSSNLRQGASILNDSTANLYLSLSASASSTSAFTVKLLPGALYESPKGWQGAITGIWDSTGSGFARVTELAF